MKDHVNDIEKRYLNTLVRIRLTVEKEIELFSNE